MASDSPTTRTRAPRIRSGALLLVTFSAMTISCSLAPTGGSANPAPVEVTESSIADLQTAMAEGRATSVQLVDAYLARIEAYDSRGPELNAIIQLNPLARQQAAELDAERRERGPRGPLHGIPVILKDNYDVAGLPTTGGSVALREHMPNADAFQVRRLLEAGAIILAKSNLHELAYGITTVSSLGGQTRNPYDLSRNPGGSSGGTGAAIAASFAAIGWGTDTCGSIRVPASANNLFGLRVTKGLSSIDGILPLSHTQDVGGPLARTMADLATGLDATVGQDPADPATIALEGRSLPRFSESARQNPFRGVRIGVLTNYFGSEPEEEETNTVVRAALAEIAALGAEVVEVEIPDFDTLLSGTSLIDFEFKWDLMDYLARVPDPPVRSLTEIVEGELHHAAVAGVLGRSDRHETRSPDGSSEALAKRAVSTERILEFLNERGLDALAYPSLRRPPAVIGEPARGNNCQLSATTGFPALTVPAGFTPGGLPVGLELLARPFEDDRLVSFGFAFEAATRHRRMPGTTPPLIGN